MGPVRESHEKIGYFFGALLTQKEYNILTYFSSRYDKIECSGYDLFSINFVKIEKVIKEPKEIAIMVKSLGEKYSSNNSITFDDILEDITRSIENYPLTDEE